MDAREALHPASTEPLVRIECDKHATFIPASDDTGYVPCPWCYADSLWEQLNEARVERGRRVHRRHRLWSATKLWRRMVSIGTLLGVLSGSGTLWDENCNACTTARFRGRRLYILGWPPPKWACLLKFRHWPGEEIDGLGMCGKCLPCPECDSQTNEHNKGCELV